MNENKNNSEIIYNLIQNTTYFEEINIYGFENMSKIVIDTMKFSLKLNIIKPKLKLNLFNLRITTSN